MTFINNELLHDPFMTAYNIKHKLNLAGSTRTVRSYIKLLGWRRVRTSYCQIVSFNNRVKRYIYGCFCKIYSENYHDVVFVDETTIEINYVI